LRSENRSRLKSVSAVGFLVHLPIHVEFHSRHAFEEAAMPLPKLGSLINGELEVWVWADDHDACRDRISRDVKVVRKLWRQLWLQHPWRAITIDLPWVEKLIPALLQSGGHCGQPRCGRSPPSHCAGWQHAQSHLLCIQYGVNFFNGASLFSLLSMIFSDVIVTWSVMYWHVHFCTDLPGFRV